MKAALRDSAKDYAREMRRVRAKEIPHVSHDVAERLLQAALELGERELKKDQNST